MATKDYGSQTSDYETPLDSIVNKIMGFLKIDKFSIDVCCASSNIPAMYYYTKEGVFINDEDDGFCQIMDRDGSLKCSNGLNTGWFGYCFMNPPWRYTREWLKKAFDEVVKNNCGIWAVLPADRLNMIFFNKLLRENSNWFMIIPQVGEGQKFNFYNPHISQEENEKNLKNGGFKKPFMILYIGKNVAEYAQRWQQEQPIISIVMTSPFKVKQSLKNNLV